MDSRYERKRFALRVGRGLLYAVPFLIGFLCARPAAAQWPVREFEVVSLEELEISAPGMIGPPGSTLPSLFNTVSGQVDETVPIAGDRGTRRLDLAGGQSGAAVNYSATTAGGSYRAVEGAIAVEWVASPDGTIRLEGQFDGILQAQNGDGRIRVDSGRIEVEGIPPDALLAR
jgi:hypothetical protein